MVESFVVYMVEAAVDILSTSCDVESGPERRLEALGGGLGATGRVRGDVRGGPGGVLRGSWAFLERSWSDFLSTPISDRFFDRF